MNSKSAKKVDDGTVLTEILDLTESSHTGTNIVKDPLNLNIQKKFDDALGGFSFEESGELDFLATSDEKSDDVNTSSNNRDEHDLPSIDFNDSDDELVLGASDDGPIVAHSNDNSMDLSIDGSDGLNFDLDAMNDESFDESTKKTEITMKSEIDFEMSSDMLSTSEAKENIEATINNIIRPKSEEGTSEFDLGSMIDNEAEAFSFDNESQDHDNSNIEITSKSFTLEVPENFKVQENTSPSLSKKNTLSDDDLFGSEVSDEVVTKPNEAHAEVYSKADSYKSESTHIGDDEYIRLQSTIRMLREEREASLSNIKELKKSIKEYEEDNLSLKSALDEAKIEVAILRKRNLTEVEDFKYRLGLSEEKRSMAEEKTKMLEKLKEKLEQKTRIDFNQVRHREKELESKLELLAMDVDSQVNSRDQKILELRRKIDSLEFNMENVTIREQKSTEDKVKLEDKLNKIMKTLRNSIKNLEDDIEAGTDEISNLGKNK